MEQKPNHPNGKPILNSLVIPKTGRRDDSAIFEDVFPNSEIGKLLKGLLVEFLIKQEHRSGWARKSACDESVLNLRPNETVAAHMWGVARIIMVVSKSSQFNQELPKFDVLGAMDMALTHDIAELIVGDYTPVDKITPEEKHQEEKEAMERILSNYPDTVRELLRNIYTSYENRSCIESKFVKDCDKLDFILNAFLLERQGFSGFEEFYPNTLCSGFSTNIASDMAETLVKTRGELIEKNLLFRVNN